MRMMYANDVCEILCFLPCFSDFARWNMRMMYVKYFLRPVSVYLCVL